MTHSHVCEVVEVRPNCTGRRGGQSSAPWWHWPKEMSLIAEKKFWVMRPSWGHLQLPQNRAEVEEKRGRYWKFYPRRASPRGRAGPGEAAPDEAGPRCDTCPQVDLAMPGCWAAWAGCTGLSMPFMASPIIRLWPGIRRPELC